MHTQLRKEHSAMKFSHTIFLITKLCYKIFHKVRNKKKFKQLAKLQFGLADSSAFDDELYTVALSFVMNYWVLTAERMQ